MINSRETVEIALALIAAWEKCDLSAAAHLLADDFTLTGPAPVPLGKQEFLGFQAIHNEAFADWQFNPRAIAVDGQSVELAYQITATHTGAYDVAKLGIPIQPVAPTGRSRAWPAERMAFTVSEGKVAKLDVPNTPGAGVAGTLEWLQVELPAAMA